MRARSLKRWFYFPYALFLAVLVSRNYEKRARGELPDEWYWADEKLLMLGWALTGLFPHYRLRKF